MIQEWPGSGPVWKWDRTDHNGAVWKSCSLKIVTLVSWLSDRVWGLPTKNYCMMKANSAGRKLNFPIRGAQNKLWKSRLCHQSDNKLRLWVRWSWRLCSSDLKDAGRCFSINTQLARKQQDSRDLKVIARKLPDFKHRLLMWKRKLYLHVLRPCVSRDNLACL